jgi:hypothetical protein
MHLHEMGLNLALVEKGARKRGGGSGESSEWPEGKKRCKNENKRN